MVPRSIPAAIRKAAATAAPLDDPTKSPSRWARSLVVSKASPSDTDQLIVEIVRPVDAGHHRLGHVLQPLDRVPDLGLDADDPHAGHPRPQVAAGTHQRAGRAHAGDEVVDLSAGLLVDLRTGRLEVGQDVVGILVLVGHEVPRRLLLQERVGLPIAPSMPSLAGVRITLAPRPWRMRLRSVLTHSGMQSSTR